MTSENILRLYKHFSNLAKGNFTEDDFVKDYGKGGRTSVGEMSPERIRLIKSDATRAKIEIETKFPSVLEINKSVEATQTEKVIKKKEVNL